MDYKEITEEKVILALDGLSKEEAIKIVNEVGESVYAVKIHDLYDCFGPSIVMDLLAEGAVRVWVDAKLHDIPTAVKNRTAAIKASGAGIISVHAAGGVAMMAAAAENINRVYAVTVLTSTGQSEYGAESSCGCSVAGLVDSVLETKVRGIVCSSNDVKKLLAAQGFSNPAFLNEDFEFIVPGIRPEGFDSHDHVQFDTPANAIRNGATRLVIGRPITQSDDPVGVLEKIGQEIASANSEA